MEKKFYSDRVAVEISMYNKPPLCKPFIITGDAYKTRDVETQTRKFSSLELSVAILNKKIDLWVRVEDK